MYEKTSIKSLSVTVDQSFSGSRIDKFFSEKFIEYSRSRIKVLIIEGHVSSSNRKITDPSRRVKSGECYKIIIPALKSAVPVGQKMNLNIIFEDNDLIVINKLAGLVVHPAAGNPDKTLVNALIAHCGNSLSGIGGEARPGIVHRLDKDTSGLIVVAKNDIVHRNLSEQFAEHTIDRAYKAVVWGVPKVKVGIIKGNIGRSPRNRKKMAIVKRGGKYAATHYKTEKIIGLDNRIFASLIDCRLETGRTHQIRVHMTSIGHPIIGDPVYGSKNVKNTNIDKTVKFTQAVNSLKGQALHAYLIGFIHPISGKKLSFESPLPADMLALF